MRRFSFLLAVPFAALALAAAEPDDFRYFKPLTPPARIDPGLLNSVKLDREVYAKLEKPDDLRLFDATGRELPCRRERQYERGVARRSEPAKVVVRSFAVEEGRAILEVELASKNRPGARVNRLAIQTLERNFEKKVAIYAPDGAGWKLLAQELPFFDQSARIDLRNFSFSFPEGFYRKLRLVIDNYGEDYVSPLRRITTGEVPAVRKEERELLFRELKIDGVAASREYEVPVPSRPLTETCALSIESIEEDRKAGTTVITFTADGLPLSGLELLTSSRNFSRPAVLEELEGSFRQAGQFDHLALPNFRRDSRRLNFAEIRLRRCRLTIRNGDSPPLENLELRGFGPAYHLISLGDVVPGRLAYVGNGLPPGDYDLARLLSGVDTAVRNFNVYAVGPAEENPHFRPSPPSPSRYGRPLFFVVIAVLAAALIVFIVRSAGRIEKELPGENEQ